jgi:predicted Zn-dependent protease
MINVKISRIIVPTILLLSLACATAPLTGRKQLLLIPNSELNAMSFQQYSEFVSSHKLSDDKQKTAMVKDVGVRIQRAVEQYFASRGESRHLKGYKWEFNLVEDDAVNAWCMPGGKVVVYTGILPVTRDENGLAVVMGHEIAHAVANHGNERMSQGLVTQLGGLALAKALETKKEETQNLFLAAYGVGATVGVLLPYSRAQESEADHLGLIFMAMAGFNPSGAVEFWQRMAKEGGASPPEFLSTHPSDETRIRKIREALPEAMKYYKP